MNNPQINGHSSLQNGSDEDFELMGDMPKEDPIIAERRRMRNNEITKKLGAYLLKGYCMLSDACPQCDCILLRTPDRQLLCVGCTEVDVENPTGNKETTKGEDEQRLTSAQPIVKKKDRVKHSKKRNKKTSVTYDSENVSSENTNYSVQLENKLKWAVDELTKSQNPNRITAMCTVITKLTESIKALKEYETASA
ncbi:unnamed protein product [Rotaria sp. Silwood2]|nr:unnamed protein product [Rotaria sp. Silwood2]CAF2659207.1 unnamed protein product [Rotaria sp. Silwood2]CAF2910375.1 unnamed protein product [Rotaria sp. Silwood2]CAF3067058.1 unnamed protein product [Rotaria sp. Silwood2]CAF3879706.1 unnamed protein product [Rotaria sp. Silwood2]